MDPQNWRTLDAQNPAEARLDCRFSDTHTARQSSIGHTSVEYNQIYEIDVYWTGYFHDS